MADERAMAPQVFTCKDCGSTVYLFSATPPYVPSRCGICQTISDVPNRADRALLRERLYDAEAMSHWLRSGHAP